MITGNWSVVLLQIASKKNPHQHFKALLMGTILRKISHFKIIFSQILLKLINQPNFRPAICHGDFCCLACFGRTAF